MSSEHSGFQYWVDKIKAWEESGLTQKFFCDERGINYKVFNAKLQTYRKKSATPKASSFLPVKVSSRSSNKKPCDASLRVFLTSGAYFEIRHDAGIKLAAKLLKALGS